MLPPSSSLPKATRGRPCSYTSCLCSITWQFCFHGNSLNSTADLLHIYTQPAGRLPWPHISTLLYIPIPLCIPIPKHHQPFCKTLTHIQTFWGTSDPPKTLQMAFLSLVFPHWNGKRQMFTDALRRDFPRALLGLMLLRSLSWVNIQECQAPCGCFLLCLIYAATWRGRMSCFVSLHLQSNTVGLPAVEFKVAIVFCLVIRVTHLLQFSSLSKAFLKVGCSKSLGSLSTPQLPLKMPRVLAWVQLPSWGRDVCVLKSHACSSHLFL